MIPRKKTREKKQAIHGKGYMGGKVSIGRENANEGKCKWRPRRVNYFHQADVET